VIHDDPDRRLRTVAGERNAPAKNDQREFENRINIAKNVGREYRRAYRSDDGVKRVPHGIDSRDLIGEKLGKVSQSRRE